MKTYYTYLTVPANACSAAFIDAYLGTVPLIKLPKITLKLKMINYYYLVTDFKNPLFVGIVGYIKNLKKFLKIVDISLDSVIIYRCQGGPDTKYIIIH